MLRNNRGEVEKHEEVDHDVMIAQLDEDEKAEKEERDPEDLIAKSKQKADESTENDDEPDPEDIEEKPEDEETEEPEDKPEEESEEESETKESEEEEEEEPKVVDRDAQITAHAEENGISYADAKEDLEKTDKIVEQFKGDPKAMAKAMRSKDREYDKLKNEKEKAVERPPLVQPLSEDEFRVALKSRIDSDPEKYVEGYRRRYPEGSETMTDGAIIEKVVDREWLGYDNWSRGEESKAVNRAKKIKDDFISNISEEDRKFLPEVKVMMDRITPDQVLKNTFNPNLLIDIARGQNAKAEIKAAEDRGFKRGKESAKILGLKTSKAGSSRPAGKKESGPVLDNEQKARAEEMYGDMDGYSSEKAYKMFKETYEVQLKENPKFY